MDDVRELLQSQYDQELLFADGFDRRLLEYPLILAMLELFIVSIR